MNVAISQSVAKHFVSRDSHRPAMMGVYFDTKARKAVMTNGHILLTVDIDPEPDEVSFVAPLQALPKKREAVITFDGSVITTVEPGQPVVANEPIEEQYPLWQQVIPDTPDDRAGVTSIGYNPALFAGFAAVVKSLGGGGIRLDLLADNKAAKVTPYVPAPWEGLIMPIMPKTGR